LRARAAFALHAAVGLDAAKRQDVERLLLRALQAPDLPESRTDLALAASELGELTPAAASVVGQALVGALGRTTDPLERRFLAQGLAAVVGRMAPKESARALAEAAALLTQALTTTTDLRALVALEQGLALVAGRMKPKEAAEVAAVLTQALADTTNPQVRLCLARGVSTVADRMETREAARASTDTAALLARAMAKTTNYNGPGGACAGNVNRGGTPQQGSLGSPPAWGTSCGTGRLRSTRKALSRRLLDCWHFPGPIFLTGIATCRHFFVSACSCFGGSCRCAEVRSGPAPAFSPRAVHRPVAGCSPGFRAAQDSLGGVPCVC
jgi:hypothetical protein